MWHVLWKIRATAYFGLLLALKNWYKTLEDTSQFLTIVGMVGYGKSLQNFGATKIGLTASCQNDHYHKPWSPVKLDGKLHCPTSEEAAYPILLCERIAGIILDKALSMGATVAMDLQQQQQTTDESTHRFLLDILPRGNRFKPLVSEFKGYNNYVHWPDKQDEFQRALNLLPKGSKVVNRRLSKWGELRVDEDESRASDNHWIFLVDQKLYAQNVIVEAQQVGLPREPIDFVKRALQCGHPRSMSVHLPEMVQQVLEENLSEELFSLAKKRTSWLWKWAKRVGELEKEEHLLKESMPEHLRVLLGKKKFLLLCEMLIECGYPVEELVKDTTWGFNLTGWTSSSGVFPKRVKRPQYDVDTLQTLAAGLNKSIQSHMQALEDDDVVNQATWQQTLEEVAKAISGMMMGLKLLRVHLQNVLGWFRKTKSEW